MEASDNSQTPNPPAGWFSQQSRRVRAMLLALLFLAVSVGSFLLGLHGLHAGESLTNMAGRSDWGDSFLWSAGTFILSAVLFAAALGWKPEELKFLRKR